MYHLGARGIEFDLLPACARQTASRSWPIRRWAGGEVLDDPALATIAKARGLMPATVALAWVLRQPGR